MDKQTATYCTTVAKKTMGRTEKKRNETGKSKGNNKGRGKGKGKSKAKGKGKRKGKGGKGQQPTKKKKKGTGSALEKSAHGANGATKRNAGKGGKKRKRSSERNRSNSSGTQKNISRGQRNNKGAHSEKKDSAKTEKANGNGKGKWSNPRGKCRKTTDRSSAPQYKEPAAGTVTADTDTPLLKMKRLREGEGEEVSSIINAKKAVKTSCNSHSSALNVGAKQTTLIGQQNQGSDVRVTTKFMRDTLQRLLERYGGFDQMPSFVKRQAENMGLKDDLSLTESAVESSTKASSIKAANDKKLLLPPQIESKSTTTTTTTTTTNMAAAAAAAATSTVAVNSEPLSASSKPNSSTSSSTTAISDKNQKAFKTRDGLLDAARKMKTARSTVRASRPMQVASAMKVSMSSTPNIRISDVSSTATASVVVNCSRSETSSRKQIVDDEGAEVRGAIKGYRGKAKLKPRHEKKNWQKSCKSSSSASAITNPAAAAEAAAGGGTTATREHVEIQSTPVRRAWAQQIEFIQLLGKHLSLAAPTTALAVRYYVPLFEEQWQAATNQPEKISPICFYEPHFIGTCCVFLAAKVSEQPRKIRDVLNMGHAIAPFGDIYRTLSKYSKGSSSRGESSTVSKLLQYRTPLSRGLCAYEWKYLPHHPSDAVGTINSDTLLGLDSKYWALKACMIECEQIILRALGFHLEFDLPHRYLCQYMHNFGILVPSIGCRPDDSMTHLPEPHLAFVMAWALLNDSLRIKEVALLKPNVVAAAVTYLGSEMGDIIYPGDGAITGSWALQQVVQGGANANRNTNRGRAYSGSETSISMSMPLEYSGLKRLPKGPVQGPSMPPVWWEVLGVSTTEMEQACHHILDSLHVQAGPKYQ